MKRWRDDQDGCSAAWPIVARRSEGEALGIQRRSAVPEAGPTQRGDDGLPAADKLEEEDRRRRIRSPSEAETELSQSSEHEIGAGRRVASSAPSSALVPCARPSRQNRHAVRQQREGKLDAVVRLPPRARGSACGSSRTPPSSSVDRHKPRRARSCPSPTRNS